VRKKNTILFLGVCVDGVLAYFCMYISLRHISYADMYIYVRTHAYDTFMLVSWNSK
jgi:hypothetical protein